MIAFLDASALIYLIEGAEPFAGRVRAALRTLFKSHRQLSLSVSRLSWLECRVKPARQKHAALLADYDHFFALRELIWIELSRDVVELATAIRVTHGLKTADALQAASSLQLGQDHRFLTGDTVFRKVLGLQVIRTA